MLLNWGKENWRNELSIYREWNTIQVFILSDVGLEVFFFFFPFFFFNLSSFVLTQGESLRRVLIHIVRACCFLSANVILGFDYVDNFLLPFRASGSRGSGVRMCNWIARIKSMYIPDFFQYYFILFFNFSFRTIPISSKPTFNFGMK